MANYNKQKFYWLQLKEDFFEEDAIEWLEEQDNGKEYSLFYLKLCLKSLRHNGVMVRQVGNMLVPYDATKLAEITKTDIDTVKVAMNLLSQIGLVTILENGELYLNEVSNMIGSQSIGAFKKEQQRLAKKEQLELGSGQEMDNCPPKIELELENKDKSIEKELYLEFVKLSDDEFDKLVDRFGTNQTNDLIERLNNYIGSKGKKYKSHYHTILNWARKDNDKGTNVDVFDMV